MKYLSYDKLPHLKNIIKNALNSKSNIGHTHTIGDGTLDESGIKQLVVEVLIEQGLIQLEDLTSEQIEAINNMSCDIDENGNLQINYDDTILAVNFKMENGNLIAETNVDRLSFNINSNGEMEAIY